jgi:hypothetical protein
MIAIELDLKNAGFEGAWREVDGVHEVKVADDWHPWWHRSDVRPEYKIATKDVDANRIHGGRAAQQWFTTHATHTGGIYQQVQDVPIGNALVFTAWVQAFSRDDDEDWRTSNGRYRMRVGLDPYGGTDPEASDVVWSDVVQPYDAWTQVQVNTTARSDRCTVFLWGQAEWPVKHNNGYVDDCQLVYLAPEALPPEPPPPEPPPEPPPPEPPPEPPATAEDVAKLAQAVKAYALAVAQAADELAQKINDLGK